MQGAEGELYMVKANSFQIFQGNLETCSQKKKKKTISISMNHFLSQILLQGNIIAEKLEFRKCSPT